MNLLVIGSTGQLGWELQRSLLPLGQISALDYPDLDLTRPDSIANWVERTQPDVIFNAAAYTAVDRAEQEPDLAQAVNGIAPGILAELAQARGSILIHYSTDYVFDGEKGAPYREEDHPAPINHYGRSKLAGEQAVQQVGGDYYIFRTSWLYSTRRDCFLTRVLRWARTKKILRIVSDQTGSPTWARTLADASAGAARLMLERGKDWRESTSGIYHTAGVGAVNRFEWARKILALDPQPEEHTFAVLQEACSEDFDTDAPRPAFSALDCTRFQETFNGLFVNWADALAEALSG